MINKLKISLLLLSISLYGCDALLQSSEDRINAAIPMYRDIVQSIDNVLESVTAEKRKEIENEISKRLKIRALTCSGGYTPSWSDSEEDIRKRLRDRSCFNNSDIEFAK